MWEDPACSDGGRWVIRTPKEVTTKFLEDLILALIGDQFDVAQGEVLGLVLSVKYNNDTISIWHRTASDPAVVSALKASIESKLDMQEGMALEYENFKEALNTPKQPRVYDNNGGFNRGGYHQRGNFRGRGRGSRGGRGGAHVQEAPDSAFE